MYIISSNAYIYIYNTHTKPLRKWTVDFRLQYFHSKKKKLLLPAVTYIWKPMIFNLLRFFKGSLMESHIIWILILYC